MTVSTEQIEEAISAYSDPYYPEKDLVRRRAIKHLQVAGGRVNLKIGLGYPAEGIRQKIHDELLALVRAVPGVESVELEIVWDVAAGKNQQDMKNLSNVKNVVAVASGKGGVGKSTTAVNLALALVAEGARVGLLDADIYGPSQPIMLGIEQGRQPEQREGKYFLPMEAHGLQAMSMGFLVTEDTPMVWRGPMASGALQQLITQTLWNNLDYLIVDMPPGTGDIQLTLAQKVPVTGAVIVTTPQDIALLDAKKGIEMFQKVGIPVLGIVENMAMHICSNCGHAEHMFGKGGGEQIAKEYNAPLLASLPLDVTIRQQVDGGNPTVSAEPEGTIAMIYREMARHVGANIAKRGTNPAHNPLEIIARND